MNEEDTGPLFKYTPEISSQFLIQSNENPEFVQVPGICDDLLLTGFEDGTVTWTLGGLPVLLNEQQPLLVNQINTDSEPQQELLQDILSQAAIEIANSDEAASIECPLEIPDKEFLTNNGLFISNEPDLPQQYVKHSESADDEIQSSDVSSQEAFIDINGLLIPQESILSLNNDDLLFNIEHAHQPSSSIKSNKARTRRKVPTLVQNQDEELRVEKNPETVFTYDEPPNNKGLVKVLNLDGTVSMLNVDGMLAGNRPVLKQISDIAPVTADELFLKDEHDLTSIQPDSTVMNDETFNIDDFATIITAYQCKKCAFTCNDQKLFLKHFKTTHIPIRTAPEPLDTLAKIITGSTPRPAERTLNQFKILNSGEIVTRLTFLRNPKDTTFILPAEAIKTDEPEFEMKNAELEILENKIKTEIFNIENSFKIEPPDTPVPNIDNNNSEFLHVSIIDDDNFEKRIMRVKRKKKTTPMYNNKKQMIAKQQGSYIGARKEIHEQSNRNSLLQLDNDEPRSASRDVRLSDPKALRKQLLYLCSDCGKEFSTVEDCRTHMIRIHKFRNVEAVSKQPDESKEALGMIDNPVTESEDGDDNDEKNKNKKIIDKFLTQDIMKPRRNKCTKTGCQYRFAKPELLARHESCHVEGVRGVFKCPECGEKQTSWRLCSVHLWRCHQLDVDLYACPLCTFKGSTFVKLKHHLKIHGDERDYICTECDRAFKQPSQLRNHRVIHLDPAIHEVPHWYIQKHCDKCGKMFADSKCLKKHVQAVHSKLKPFICNVCGHTCARKAMLQMHLRQHTGEKPYSCKLCYYKTGDHNSLRRHEMRHTGARPYKCPHCDYTAIQSNSYKNHLASKHPGMSGSFSCTDCNFKTVNEDSFVSHLNDHKIGLIEKSDESDPKISRIRILYDQSNLATADITTDNKNGIIIQLPNSKNLDLEDDETQNCFLSLGDLNDEQTVDTGGITIPADPDPMNM